MPQSLETYERVSQDNKLNPARQNEFIQEALKESIKSQFPVIGKYHTLEMIGIPKVEDDLDDLDLPAQKEIKLVGKTWQVPVYATFRLRDNKTNMVLDEIKNIKIANIPKLTDRFSMIIGGNEYTTINQFRLKAGVYARQKENGEMESFFNLAVGYNFKMELDPAEGVFYLFVAKQRFHLYTLLHALSISDSVMETYWGQELLDKNKAAGINEGEHEIPLLWEKLRRQTLSYSEALTNIKEYLSNTRMDPDVTKLTLGSSFDRVSSESLLASSTKLLKVMRGELPEDERDSLLFKQLYTVDEQLKEYVTKTSDGVLRNLKYRTDNKDNVREIISSDTYTKPIRKFFTTGDLSNPSPQTNPVEMASEWRKTTITGSGGIQSEHAITLKTRDVHPSHLGYLDPLHTPEGHKVGVTLSLGLGVRKRGKDLTTTIVLPDGKQKEVTPIEFYNMKMGFPDQHENGKALNKEVKAMYRGEAGILAKKDIDGYLLDPQTMYGWTTNLVPFLGNNSGNRAAVAAKMASQAVPLKDIEAPLVKIQSMSGRTMDELLGMIATTRLPSTHSIKRGEVLAVDKDYITVRDQDNKNHKIGLYNDFPLNQESFLNSVPLVKVGDKIKAGDVLARNNFTDADRNYAYGINTTVAYMPWYGYNFEDGLVVTESLAKKMTSTVILKKSVDVSTDGILNKKKFVAFFPEAVTFSNLNKLDDNGVIKEGEKILPRETLVTYLSKVELSDTERILKQMNRVISNPYRNRSLVWDGEHEGTIKYVRKVGNTVSVWIYEEQPLTVGDKVAARYGDKGIITKIISDDEAPYTKDGTRIDLIFNPHGVVGRMNMGQMLETAAGKLAMKTGKPYIVKNFSGKDYLTDIMNQLKKHNIPTDEILYTKEGKPLTKNPVFWGSKYYLKLMHVVEHKYKSRDIPGTYDANEQPAKGEEGGQSVDPLQMYALLAHGARKNLFEFAAIKSQKNDEYWRNLQLGFPPPLPQKNFVFDKMLAYMQAAGINIEKNGYKLKLYPATTKDVLSWSSGEIKDAGHMLRGKDLMELEGGLFDPKLTGGGLKGTNWNHMVLNEPMPNPIFENAIQNLTGINGNQYNQIMNEELSMDGLTGTKLIQRRLSSINVEAEYKNAVVALQKAAPTQVNMLNHKVRYLKVLKDFKLRPEDAYLMKAVPILPPLYRPIYPLPSGDLQVSPINKHYHDISLINNQIQAIKKAGVDSKEFNKTNRIALYNSLKALMGLTDPATFTREKYEGLLKTLSGESPKEGFIQNKVWGRRQDLSARSTVTVEPSIGVDEIGLPEPMLRSIMKPFVIRELVRQGNKPIEAVKQYKEWSPLADQALNVVIKQRPVLMNRAPSLHKHNIQAFYPIRFDGMSIRVNPLIVKGLNMDFDGDTASIHVPVSEDAIREAQGMVPSKNLHKAGDREHMHQFSQDYQLGLYFLTVPGKDTKKKFKTTTEASKAGLSPQDQFLLNGKKTTLGKELVNSVLPKPLQNYDTEYNSKYVKGLVEKLYNEYPNKFSEVVDHFKNVGRQYAVDRGSTLSLSDIAIDHGYRDKILEKYEKQMTPGMTADKRVELYMQAKDDIVKKQDELFSKNNRFYDMLRSGSSSKAEPVSQILSMPGILTDVHGRPMPIPVKKSWSEGLDTFDYWNQAYGARKGVVDKSINTQESGGLNKELLFNTKNLLIVEDDCGTPNYIDIDINSKEVFDRHLGKTVSGVGQRNTLVTAEIIQRAKQKHLQTLPVRSPLTCEADGGVCVQCYGLMPNGQPARIGDNVGVLDSEAITERSTQLTLQTFHSGGAASAKTGIMAGFPRLKELLYVQQTIMDKAVLAEEDGVVRSILPNPAGGFDLYINDKRYYVPRENSLRVSVGETVKRGDALTTGSIKPQELSKLKNHLTAQLYSANEINKIYDNKFSRKSIENVLRATSNFAEIDHIPPKTQTTWMHGDTVPLTAITKLNRELVEEGKPEIKFTPIFKSIDVLPLKSQDWLSRLTTNRLKDTIRDAAAMGYETDLKGTDPMPAYLAATEFGQHLDPSKKMLY
jgi:DNA-directed RNA polymerase subunit beta'